jgi:8-oxo-dGTP pyrophosphatase MutT (NUDIX family)
MSSTTVRSSIPEKLRELLSDRSSEKSLGESWTASSSLDAYRQLAPQYAFGRHRGPAPRHSHPAAVLLVLIPDNQGGWSIPLTLRPPQMVDHAGQISLPGGRAEAGETVWTTACREFGEELGCSTEHLQPIGQLRSLYVYASRHQVIPMVSVCSLLPSFRPNPEEVAELIFFPLHSLVLADAIVLGTMQRGSSLFDVPGFRVGDHFVWGATAMILGELRQLVRSIVEAEPQLPWFR